MKFFKYLMGFIAGIMVLVGILVGLPALLIWSINTLFGLGIVYSWKTILAGFVIIVFFVHKDIRYVR